MYVARSSARTFNQSINRSITRQDEMLIEHHFWSRNCHSNRQSAD